MQSGRALSALNQYRATSVAASLEDASPHRLVGMLFDGAISRIGQAQHAMRRGDAAAKGRLIGDVLSIIDALRASLNREAGGELAERLSALYQYISGRLMRGSVENDSAPLDEALQLLGEISSAWQAVPPELQRGMAP